MDNFSEKMRIVYIKLCNEDIDKYVEEFIDWNKRKPDDTKESFKAKRKTVCVRLKKDNSRCSNDFKKSFKNYKISKHILKGEPLFRLKDFSSSEVSLNDFERRIELYLQDKRRVYLPIEYKYFYFFDEKIKRIVAYSIIDKRRGERENETEIILEDDEKNSYKGVLLLKDGDNLFITMKIKDDITLYFLFHDTKDKSCPYIVGMSMGYFALDDKVDNRVPSAKKAVFSEEKLDEKNVEALVFILNEAESISAIENRLNHHTQEVKTGYFVKYSNRFEKHYNFFSRLIEKRYLQSFYHRLAFREFYGFYRLFQNFSKKESYFIINYHSAILEAIETLESIKNIPFYFVTQLDGNSLFFGDADDDIKIKERFLNLYRFGIEIRAIFVVKNEQKLSPRCIALLKEMQEYNISIKLVEKSRVFDKVESLDFFFIHQNDKRDFVLADPLRDDKDIFRLFIDEVSLDEYRTYYRKISQNATEYISSKEKP